MVSKDDVPQPIDPLQFFMTINSIFYLIPTQEVDQIVDDILLPWVVTNFQAVEKGDLQGGTLQCGIHFHNLYH